MGVVKAAFRHATDEGHLATFKSETDAAAATCFLTLVAFAGGLAVAAAFAAADSFYTVGCAGTGFKIGEIHRYISVEPACFFIADMARCQPLLLCNLGFRCDAAQFQHVFALAELRKGVKGRPEDVGVVRGTKALG